jgi:hypothetical protein
MGRIRTPLEERLRTIESMIEECNNELNDLRKVWLNKYYGKRTRIEEVRRGSRVPFEPTEFDFFFDNRERSIELGAVLAYLRLKRSQCYDELEGEDTEMV